MKTVSVIGLGEVGTPVFEDLHTCNRPPEKFDIYGMDINQQRVWELRELGYEVGTEMIASDVYIICVYTTDQVIDVIKKIPNKGKDVLISVESTLDPEVDYMLTESLLGEANLVLFPHRFNPNDPDHRVFNLDRVMGARTEKEIDIALEFYSHFMHLSYVHVVPFEIAALTKVAENAYRFMEIALSEAMRMAIEEDDLSYEELRQAMNTKWNIDVKEARDGIGGHCLPKDMDLFRKWCYNSLEVFDRLFYTDAEYKRKYGFHR